MISGAQYLVKALQEEQVEILFNYPGAATIDIMDELYKQRSGKGYFASSRASVSSCC